MQTFLDNDDENVHTFIDDNDDENSECIQNDNDDDENPEDDIYNVNVQNTKDGSDDGEEMKINHNSYDPNQFCINQNNIFINKNFIPPQITSKKVKGAKNKISTTKSKASNSIKENHRTPITFATKAIFCSKVEHAGMNRRQAWNWMNQNGYNVGRSSGSCHKWAAKGSHHWMSLIAKQGDRMKFGFIIIIIILLYPYTNLQISRNRDRNSKYPELERRLLSKILSRDKYGLYRTMPSIQQLALRIAKQLKIKGFSSSRHWVYNFTARNNLKWKRRSTHKQQTVHSYLIVWDQWIDCLRNYSISLGIVTPRGYIRSFKLWNADEFGLEPLSHDYKHLTGPGTMVNSQQLRMTLNVTKRYCTVTGLVPKSGFQS